MAEEEGKKSKLLGVIIAVLVVLALMLGGAFYFMTQSGGEESTAQDTQTPEASTNLDASQGNSNYIRIGPTYQLDQIIVNLLTQSGRRYIKANIALEMTNPELQNELDTKRAAIRDTIILILSSKSFEEVSTERGKIKLKEEIAQKLNAFLVDGKIRNVFLSDIMIQ